MKYMQKILVNTALLAIPALSMAGSYALVPGVNYVSLGKSRSVTTSYTVANQDNSSLVLTVTPVYQAPGTDNPGPFQEDKALADQSQFSLLPYIRVSPPKLNIQPNDARTVRVSIRLPGNLPAGTYRAGIDFAEQASPNNASTVQLKPNQLGAQITPLVDQITALYVNVGKGNAQNAQVTCRKVGTGDIQISVHNNTNWIFNPDVSIYNAASSSSTDKPLTKVIPIPVMAQTAGTREIKWQTTDQGPYKVIWRLRETKNAVSTTLMCQ